MKVILLVLLGVSSSFACEVTLLKQQRTVTERLIAKYSADKTRPLASIRKIEFIGLNTVRFLYVSKAGSVHNVIGDYKLSDSCTVSLNIR